MNPLLRRTREKIEKEWGGHPGAQESLKIIDYLNKQNLNKVRMLTMSQILYICDKDRIDQDVMVGLAILSNLPVAILEKGFLCIDERTEDAYELQADEVEDLLRKGDFFHPEINERIESDYVVPFFMPSSKLFAEDKDA
jgi:hypothetical protein